MTQNISTSELNHIQLATLSNEEERGPNGYLDMELLRFSTAGSVDDGKSTLWENTPKRTICPPNGQRSCSGRMLGK